MESTSWSRFASNFGGTLGAVLFLIWAAIALWMYITVGSVVWAVLWPLTALNFLGAGAGAPFIGLAIGAAIGLRRRQAKQEAAHLNALVHDHGAGWTHWHEHSGYHYHQTGDMHDFTPVYTHPNHLN